MPSGVSALAVPPTPRDGRGGSPGGTRRATCPRPLRPAAVADSAASLGAPVAEPSPPPAVSASPFKGSFARPVPWNPVSGTLALSPLPRPQREGGTSAASAASVPSRGKFISGAGAGHASIHSRLAGVGVGVPRARCMGSCAQSHACLFVLSPEVRPGSQCASSKEPASRGVPAAPRAGARRAGPCSGGRGGAPSGGSAPCEAARDAPATVNGAARQDTLSPGHARLCAPATGTGARERRARHRPPKQGQGRPAGAARGHVLSPTRAGTGG